MGLLQIFSLLVGRCEKESGENACIGSELIKENLYVACRYK